MAEGKKFAAVNSKHLRFQDVTDGGAAPPLLATWRLSIRFQGRCIRTEAAGTRCLQPTWTFLLNEQGRKAAFLNSSPAAANRGRSPTLFQGALVPHSIAALCFAVDMEIQTPNFFGH